MDQAEFGMDFIQSVHARKESTGVYFQDAFFEVFGEFLVESGELDECNRSFFENARGMRVDGFGGDPIDTEGKLSLIILDPQPKADSGNLTKTEMERVFRRLENFLRAALDETLLGTLEESIEAWQLADLINERWRRRTIKGVRLLLLSNRPLSGRVDRKEAGDLNGVPLTYSVWDIGRLHRLVESGQEREDLEIDFSGEFGGGIPALRADVPDAGYEAYLAVMPARQLAEVYDKWGARLLEQNVRVFLQARSKVNKGIKRTLENEAEMFFAYNNGIAATAEEVVTTSGPGGMEITKVRNLQIVNGGQTTASIHRGLSDGTADLSKVFVQLKLALVKPEEVKEIVPLISRYANTQNRVSEADFFSNHPFHVRIEEMSRRIFTPQKQGEFRQTRWFYERARGQFNDARGYLTKRERREFDSVHPRSQMFTKTDLAKFVNVWRGIPHIVSRGAQKNFAEFATHIAREWEADPKRFNELYFKHAVAKAIVFRSMERLTSNADWYPGGFRANIVAFSISRLAKAFEEQGLAPDFGPVWEAQEWPGPMEEILNRIGRAVTEILGAPPEGIANVTEWAKKPHCWERVQTIPVARAELLPISIPTSEKKSREREANRTQTMVDGIQAQMFVVGLGPEVWGEMLTWAEAKKLLSPKQRGIMQVCARPGGVPSELQSVAAVEAMRTLHEEGCTHGVEEAKAAGL